jgi:hypothetical protein
MKFLAVPFFSVALLVGLVLSGAGEARQNPAEPALPVVKRVDLRADKIPLAKALADVRRQTGFTVSDDLGEPERAVSLDLRQATFWQSVDAIAAAAGGKSLVSARDGAVSLVRRSPSDRVPPTSYDGDFRVRILRIQSSRDFDSTRSACTVSLEVSWTPTLRPLLLESQVQELRVIDEKGKAVPVVGESSSLAFVEGRYAFPLDISLPGFPRSASRIGEISGKLLAVAPNKMIAFKFAADLKALSEAPPAGALRRLNQDDVVCRLPRIKLERGQWSVTVAISYPEGGYELESYQGKSLVLNNEIALVSKDGKRSLPGSSSVVEEVGPRRALVTYHFKDRPRMPRGRAENWSLQYRAPARIVAVPFRFAFRNVDLP